MWGTIVQIIILIVSYIVEFTDICEDIIRKKGYKGCDYWTDAHGNPINKGGIFGLIDALIVPRYVDPAIHIKNEQKEKELRKEIASGKLWECPVCKNANALYVSTCSCGTPKPEDSQGDNETDMLEGWSCVKCGKLNHKGIYVCKCGMKKSENDTINKSNDIDTTSVDSTKVMTDNEICAEELGKIKVLKEYKELLDSGAITQEEYDAKKNWFLNLRGSER